MPALVLGFDGSEENMEGERERELSEFQSTGPLKPCAFNFTYMYVFSDGGGFPGYR